MSNVKDFSSFEGVSFWSVVFWKETFQSQPSHVKLNGNHFALTLRLPLAVLSAEEEKK